MNGFLIAAPQSGSGKTTVTLAIIAALGRRGLRVAPFKCGPDFIDPGYHRAACGTDSINLDAWMCDASFVADTFSRHVRGADVAVIEGVMGLFDGMGSTVMEGSSGQIAAITGATVVLVINARGMAASAVAMVRGFAAFDPRVSLAGVIFNNVGSDSHGELLRRAMADHAPEIPVFGCIPRDSAVETPSRHLGLVTVEDNRSFSQTLERLADLAERHLDLERLALLELSPSPAEPDLRPGHPSRAHVPMAGGLRIAVARDEAFCFVYPDNLRLLREAGAELVPFSPLRDRCLPPGIAGIYLPGGYPELHAEVLAANREMLAAMREAVEADMPLYAECGGLIYLTQGLAATGDKSGAGFVGLLPVRARMLARRKALGYRQVEFRSDTILGRSGTIARGHEFHYSEIGEMPDAVERCYSLSRNGAAMGLEGYRYRNCLASYVHLHFGSNPGVAESFYSACSGHETVLQG